jgi:hypothetical protein
MGSPISRSSRRSSFADRRNHHHRPVESGDSGEPRGQHDLVYHRTRMGPGLACGHAGGRRRDRNRGRGPPGRLRGRARSRASGRRRSGNGRRFERSRSGADGGRPRCRRGPGATRRETSDAGDTGGPIAPAGRVPKIGEEDSEALTSGDLFDRAATGRVVTMWLLTPTISAVGSYLVFAFVL